MDLISPNLLASVCAFVCVCVRVCVCNYLPMVIGIPRELSYWTGINDDMSSDWK